MEIDKLKPFYIISYFNFFDKGSRVGGLRPYYLYRMLLEKGLNVQLITPSANDQNQITIKEGLFTKLCKPFFKVLPPDASIIWAIKVFFFLRRVNKKKKFIVFTTSPPYGIGLTGFLCKKFLKNAVWISDYRDLWTKNTLYNPPITKKFLDPILERKFHERADLIVLNTKCDRELHRNVFPFIHSKSIFVRNGFNTVVANQSTNTNKFIYSGGTYKGIATNEIIDFLNNLNKNHNNYSCDFYGEYDESMENSSHIKYCGSIAPESVPELLSNYKYGFVYLPEGSQYGGRVAQKFYDYIGSGVIPICFNASIEMTKIIEDLNTGIIVNKNTSSADLETLFKGAKFNAQMDQVKNYTRDSQFEYLFNEIFKRNIF